MSASEGIRAFWSHPGHCRNTTTFTFGSMPLKLISLHLYILSSGTDLGQWNWLIVMASALFLKRQGKAVSIVAVKRAFSETQSHPLFQ